MIDGRLQAGARDASSVSRPNVRSTKARYIVVASSGAIVAACDPRWIMICGSPMIDAADISPSGRCRRPGCAQLFAQSAGAKKTRGRS
jgi:hypothetical protein